MTIRIAARRAALLYSSALALLVAAPAQQKIEVATEDGGAVVASVWTPNGKTVGCALLLPARRSNRYAYGPLVDRLRATDLVVVALDRRGQGEATARPTAPGPEGATSRPAGDDPFALERSDIAAVFKRLKEFGVAEDVTAIVAAGDACGLAASVASTSETVPKALVFLTPDDEGTGTAEAALAAVRAMAKRPCLVYASEEDAARGADAFREALAFPDAEHRRVARTLVHGAAIFGKEPGIEATLAQWIVEALASPRPLEIRPSIFVVIDGEPAPHESDGATFVKIPIGDAAEATVRLTRSKTTLDVAFDVPERCLRLNEVVVFIDGSGRGPRTPDASCYSVAFAPKDGTREPLLVRRGGLRGFEESDAKGAAAYARTNEKTKWTAELSLALDRFVGGTPPKAIRMAFQIKGARTTDVRNWPDTNATPTSPRTWAKVDLR